MNYEIIKLIEKGSQGEVYLAKDKDKNLIVVKKIQKNGFESRKSATRERVIPLLLQREGIHKNICEMLDFIEKNSCYIIISKYISGVDMFCWEIPDDKKILLNIAYELADGIRHMHEKNIIHRDIKPENVMMTKDNHPIIIDFGCSCTKKIHPSVKNGKYALYEYSNICSGTIDHMAPELFNYENTIKTINLKAVDIYSLGVLYFFLFNEKNLPAKNLPAKNLPAKNLPAKNLQKLSSYLNECDEKNSSEIDELIYLMMNTSSIKRPKIKRVMKIIREILNKINNIEKI